MGTGLPERYALLVEWLDPKSGILWKYHLIYYVDSKEVEMYDIKNRKTFLKKCKYDGLALAMLFIGNTVTVYSRQLKIVDYADEHTANQLSSRQERTLAMVKPDAVQHLGKIVEAITAAGFIISNMKMCKLSLADAQRFYAVHQGKPFFGRLTEFMSSGRIVALEVVGPGAIKGWRDLIGPTDSNKAREAAPQSLRAQFGTDGTCNACHGSDAPDTAAAELGFFFGQPIAQCFLGRSTALCLIKPHAVKAGHAGTILTRIQAIFEITALQVFNLDAANAGEFYEVYRGVVPAGEYSGMVDELTAGPFIAAEIADRDGADPVEAFRELAGPADPELAKVLRPDSLRAQFGVSKVKNGVHCTDLAEDGELETSYFFSILQQ